MTDTFKTQFTGIRYKKHPTRKNGKKGSIKYDRYYTIRYSIGGKQKEEGWGWESEGNTAEGAANERERIKKAIKSGKPIATLKERRVEADRLRAEKEAAEATAKKAAITFGEFFETEYIKHNADRNLRTEKALFKYQLKPVIGKKRFNEITELDMHRIRQRGVKKGKSARTIEYALSVVVTTFNLAKNHDIFHGDHPVTRDVRRKNKVNNKRSRYLSQEESDALLKLLKSMNVNTYGMAVCSLYCGLRAGEVLTLDWADVDFKAQTLTLRDTKSGEDRSIPMPLQVIEVLKNREQETGNIPVFKSRQKKRYKFIGNEYAKAVKELGLNENVTDRRNKVVFHTLRHTCASWLALKGVPLFKIQKLLGHSSIKMTERYSHLLPDELNDVADILSGIGKTSTESLKTKVVNIT